MTNPIATAINEACDKLRIAAETYPCRVAIDDADHLEALAKLSLGIAKILDPIFEAIAKAGNVTSPTERYAQEVTGAIDGMLEWKLKNAAEELRKEAAPNHFFHLHRTRTWP